MRSSGNRAGVQRREANTKKAIKVRCRTALLAAVAAFCAAADAAEFSKAGYWEAEGSPRRVETLTTGWEFSLDGFKTSKTVTLPHGIDEGELGFEASGCVNRQQPAWYRRRFTWSSGGRGAPALPVGRVASRPPTRQFLHFEAIMGKSRVTLNGKQVAEHFGGIYRDAYLIETGEAYVSDTDKGGVRITSNLGADGGDLVAITVHAATVRKGKYAPAAGELTFTPGSPDVKAKSSATKSDDARLREVERQQHDFEAGRPQ